MLTRSAFTFHASRFYVFNATRMLRIFLLRGTSQHLVSHHPPVISPAHLDYLFTGTLFHLCSSFDPLFFPSFLISLILLSYTFPFFDGSLSYFFLFIHGLVWSHLLRGSHCACAGFIGIFLVKIDIAAVLL
ncbi:hypothetical protein FPV67DRAFT_163443 [Lyophyllum atratum]|nr:hypothetical protein FPV67DRAFT_163443 [Lyophyllum atratum]